MSATSTAATTRIVEIAPNIMALHQPETGSLEFRMLDGDRIVATSNWNAEQHMTDEEIERYFADRKASIEVDFSEAISMRF